MVLPQIQKQNAFTAIRLLCGLIVLYEHFIILTGCNLPCLEIRGFAVKAFFILSGFWVTRSLFASVSLSEFYKKRIRRIFPPYLAVVVGSSVFLVFFSALGAAEYFTDFGFWKYLAANACALNFVHPDLPGVFGGEAVNGSLWTIKVELGFYIVLPPIAFLCLGRRGNSNNGGGGYRCLVILSAAYLSSVLYEVFMPAVIEKFSLPQSVAHQLPAFMSCFAVGMVCFFFYERLLPLLNKLALVAAPLLIFCAVSKGGFLAALLAPAALGIAVMWCALRARPLFVFSKAYDFSYWLYLVHYPLIMAAREVLC